MEPGEKPKRGSKRFPESQPHVHVHEPDAHMPPVHEVKLAKQENTGFFSNISNSFTSIRERGLPFKRKKPGHTQLPAQGPAVARDFELEDGHANSKTQRTIAKLSKRTSMF
jgi:hypothetical protein